MSIFKNKSLEVVSTLFIIAVTWHISYPSNILVFGLMALLIAFYFKNPFPIASKSIYIILAFAFVFILLLAFNITIYDRVYFEIIDGFIKKIKYSFLLLVFVILFYSHREQLLIKSIDNALMIMVLLWYMQFIVFYTTGEYIDLLEPIAGSERAQRYGAYFINSALPIEVIRPTSIFIEPGTYAANTFPLLVLSYLNHRKTIRLHKFTLISYFASLSLFAIIIAILYILVVEANQLKVKLNKKNVFLVLLIVLVSYGLYEYLYFRFIQENNMGAIGIRDNAIEFWKSSDTNAILFGQGNANNLFANRAHIDDTSFIFKLVFEYGILSIPFLLLMVYISYGLPLLFLAIILLTKIHYQVYIIWFYLAALHLLWNNGDNKRKHDEEN